MKKILLVFALLMQYGCIQNTTCDFSNEKSDFKFKNVEWHYSIYRYRNLSKPDSGWNEVLNIDRCLVFHEGGVLINKYFNSNRKTYDSTYGNWVINDSMFEIKFQKDSLWTYINSKDSVYILGKIGSFSREHIFIKPMKFNYENWVNFLFLTNFKN